MPFCSSVETKVGKEFSKLLDKHFGKSHAYHKIINRKTVKLAYSCMPNIKRIIQSHNRKVLNADKTEDSPSCNCRKKDQCPLNGSCTISNVIYKAVVNSNKGKKEYIGSTGGTFKKRLYNHQHSFSHYDKRFSTELSKHVWEIKRSGGEPKIEWNILRKVPNCGSGVKAICYTCNLERMAIARANKRDTLNKRSELTGKCVHRRSLYFQAG